MRPVPIPDELAEMMPGERIVVGPPNNDLDSAIAPVEAMKIDLAAGHTFAIRLVLEQGELEQLNAGAAVWLTTFGLVVPFNVHTGP